MSRCMTDTDNLTVADAIRTKGGTSAQLVYPAGFVSAIQAIQTGVTPKLVVTTSAGAAVTAIKGSKTVSGTAGTDGTCTLEIPEAGEWSVTSTANGLSDTQSIVIGTQSMSLFSVDLGGRCNGLPQRERALHMGCGRQHAYDDRRCRLSGRYRRQEP